MSLSATVRTNIGKKIKKLRREELIPAVIYGHGIAPQAISVPEGAFLSIYRTAGESSLMDITVGDAEMKALIKDVQRHPVSGKILHIDFQAVKMDEEIRAQVPLEVRGEAKAVKELGAVLVRSLSQVEVECLPQDLPHELDVDVTHLAKIGDMIRIKDLAFPAAVRVVTKPETVVALIEKKAEEEAPVAAEAAAPDLSAVRTEREVKEEEKTAKEEEEKAIES